MGRKRKRKESLWARKKRRYEGSKKEKKKARKERNSRKEGAITVWRLPGQHRWETLSWLPNLVSFGDKIMKHGSEDSVVLSQRGVLLVENNSNKSSNHLLKSPEEEKGGSETLLEMTLLLTKPSYGLRVILWTWNIQHLYEIKVINNCYFQIIYKIIIKQESIQKRKWIACGNKTWNNPVRVMPASRESWQRKYLIKTS